MHIHPGFINSLIVFLQVLAWAIAWRILAIRYADTTLGSAMLVAL